MTDYATVYRPAFHEWLRATRHQHNGLTARALIALWKAEVPARPSRSR